MLGWRFWVGAAGRIEGTAGAARVVATLAAFIGAVGLILMTGIAEVRAQDEAQAASGPPIHVGMFLTSSATRCYKPGYTRAIRQLVSVEVERVNRRGGVNGRRVVPVYFDDERSSEKAIANMRTALATPELLGLIGLTSSDRVKDVFAELGDRIGASGVPYIADNSVSDIWAAHPNVFSTRPSQTAGRAPTMAAFIKEAGYQRVGLIVNDGLEYSKALGDALVAELGSERVVADRRVGMVSDDDLDAEAVADAVASLKTANPDLVVISVGSSRTGPIIEAINAAGSPPAIFMVGSLDRVKDQVKNAYPQPIFELAWEWLPEIYNARIGDLVTSGDPEDWTFAGERNPDAEGWQTGDCEVDEALEEAKADPLHIRNLKAVSRATQFADMLSLIVHAANTAPPGSDLARRRKAVVDALSQTYTSGRRTFRGAYNDWSFEKDTRVAARPMFVVIKPGTLERPQLAPIQFLRLRDGTLRRIDTLYIDIDMIRAHRVDDSTKSFFAEFYLSMRANEEANFDRIEFTNAAVNPVTGGRQIIHEVVHDGSPDPAFPAQMKIYRVSGRFLYTPDLQHYPFDTQRFSIDIQPKNGRKAFLVQPPPLELRDGDVASDDWVPVSQYVGMGEDFVPTVDAYAHQPSVVPFYQARFVWLMKREVTDYFLRVVVPLVFILIVAYVSIFIPQSHFEAIVTIQVTALLSAVALYLSLPQLDSDTATLSDQIFLFDYMLVSLMIVISILRINKFVSESRFLKNVLAVLHVAGIPLIVALLGYYVYDLSLADGGL